MLAAAREVTATIDRIVHYAGWCDKFEQLLGNVNPVASPHFNFTVTEPIGMADAMRKQFESRGQSRQVDPYFFCEMTANGDDNTSKFISSA